MALNLVKLQDDLKMVPNAQIIAYANGSNPSVPPFLALGELQRRKKLQEAAQAEQAKEMAGAPTIKDQIEQSTGLMALQARQQPQQMQQPAPQPMMAQPMMAPQAPVQMAGGGVVQDSGTDFEGIASLPVPDNMYSEDNFAGGGIVAFAGPEGSFVETSPGFYEMQQAEEDIDESKLSPMQRMMLREIRKRRGEPDIMERRRAFGLPTEAPDTTARTRADLERRQRELEESDTFINRLLSLQPARFGSGITGRSALAYDKNRQAQMNEIQKLRAAAEDQRVAAEVAYKEGRFAEAERDRNAANNFEMEAIAKLSGLAKDEAQIKQAEAGAKSAGRIPVLEQVYADLKSGDPKRIASAQAYLGQSKTGMISDEDALNAWNKLGFVDKSKLAKMTPPVTNAMEYKQYLMRQRQAAEGGQSATPRTVDFSQLPK